MEPSHEELMTLWNLCKGFVEEHKPSCAESIYQVDEINLACPDFVIEICDCVGYYDEDDSEVDE
jgi:hypothetical protein